MVDFKDRPPNDLRGYLEFHRHSIEQREDYWRQQAERLVWSEKFSSVFDEDFSVPAVNWFKDGRLNACVNALDVQLEKGADKKLALVFFDDAGKQHSYSYQQLLDEVQQLAAALFERGMDSGKRLALYLPDCPQSLIFMLASARLGLTYVPIPARFSAEQVASIVEHCSASMLVVAESTTRKDYNKRVDELIEMSSTATLVVVGKGRLKGAVTYANMIADQAAAGKTRPPTEIGTEHPLFIQYANSATGIPRGSVMSSAGFLVQAATAHDYLFGPKSSSREPDKLYCAVELASAAGQSHGVWGPLLNGSCVVIAATGKSSASRRIGRVLDECSPVAVLSTPDRLKEWINKIEKQPLKTDRRFSLVAACRDILTPRLCKRAGEVLAEQEQRVINLWIQSETGSALICTFPGKQLNRSGALGLPFPGVTPRVCDERGKRRGPNQGGLLVFAKSWPAMLRGIWGQTERFRELYFGRIPGNFSTGDAVRVDASGYYWFMGRRDDVIKVRGFSLRTSEVEAVLQSHPKVTQAVAIGIRADDSDQLVAFVVLSASLEQKVGEETLEEELSESIEARIGDFAIPRRFVFIGQLPRTASGKITRRVLRRIAAGELARNEDLIHVANRGSIDELIEKMQG